MLVRIGGMEWGARSRPKPVCTSKRAVPKKTNSATSRKAKLQPRERPVAWRKYAI